MQKLILSSILLFLVTHWFSIAYAEVETEFGVGAQYRIDNLDWNIAGGPNGESPNILSELQWNDIKSYQLVFTAKLVAESGFYVTTNIASGSIFDGKNQDSDWALDNRNAEFSRSNNDSSDGETSDLSIGLGWSFGFGNPKSANSLSLAPIIGLSAHRQLYSITNGVQTVSDLDNLQIIDPGATAVPPLGPFDGLDSTYEAQWKGYWLGLDTEYYITGSQRIFINARYHKANYEGTGNWNLRSDLNHPVSFIHETDAQGIALSFGWIMNLNDSWRLNIDYNYQKWTSEAGVDSVFFSNNTYAETRFNEVNWDSSAIGVYITYYADSGVDDYR